MQMPFKAKWDMSSYFHNRAVFITTRFWEIESMPVMRMSWVDPSAVPAHAVHKNIFRNGTSLRNKLYPATPGRCTQCPVQFFAQSLSYWLPCWYLFSENGLVSLSFSSSESGKAIFYSRYCVKFAPWNCSNQAENCCYLYSIAYIALVALFMWQAIVFSGTRTVLEECTNQTEVTHQFPSIQSRPSWLEFRISYLCD